MSSEFVVIEIQGDVLDVVLNRPENGNRLNAVMSQAIIAAVGQLEDHIKLVRIRSSSADFCTGRESPMPSADAKPSAEALRRLVAVPPLELYDALKAVRVPVLAMVSGRAIGVGAALAGVCDISMSADNAVYQIPEMERDIPPTLVMSALLNRVPLKTIAHMVLSRATLSAQQAQQAGLISVVVPTDALATEFEALTSTLLSCGAVSLRAVKQFLHLAPEMPAAGASGFAAHLAATALSTRF